MTKKTNKVKSSKETKKGTRPLTETETYYIKGKHEHTNIQEFFDIFEGEVTKQDIEEYIEGLRDPEAAIHVGMKAGDLMARNNRGSIVMTEGASALSDVVKNKKGTKTKKNSRNIIHRIRKK